MPWGVENCTKRTNVKRNEAKGKKGTKLTFSFGKRNLLPFIPVRNKWFDRTPNTGSISNAVNTSSEFIINMLSGYEREKGGTQVFNVWRSIYVRDANSGAGFC